MMRMRPRKSVSMGPKLLSNKMQLREVMLWILATIMTMRTRTMSKKVKIPSSTHLNKPMAYNRSL